MTDSTPSQTANTLPPFSFARQSTAFEKRFNEHIPKSVNDRLTRLIPKQNIQVYAHGRSWSSNTDQGKEAEGQFTPCSVEHAMPMTDVLDCNMAALFQYIDGICNKFFAVIMRDIRDTMEVVTEETGNVVQWKKGTNTGDAFLELLRKVDFGVDENGKPTRPSLLDPPPGFVAELEQHTARVPGFKAEVERIIAAKTEAALQRETERKAKFKKPL